MEYDIIQILKEAGPLTIAALILVAGMRLGRLWSKVEKLLKISEERDERLAAIEQRIASLESHRGD